MLHNISMTCRYLVFSWMVVFALTQSASASAQSANPYDAQAQKHAETLSQSAVSRQPLKENQPKASVETEERKDEKAAVEEDKATVEEEQDLMEKALELLEMADSCWIKGDVENTLNHLDKVYALVLDTNGDVEIARQKDDLRLLIARRILALYSSQQTRINGKASEIPHLMNADVEKEIRSFQTKERDFFISSYSRSFLHRDIILKELKNAGMPEELFWLPLVESGFKVQALSRARALGLWQFIPSTGYKFGLTRGEWIDERMDITKSTLAAIAYLKELHGMFGDWLTVLAAYNCGEGRVLRVISRQKINYFDRFWDLYNQLPNETARYVPRFLATLHIIRNPEKYGFDLAEITGEPLAYETVRVHKVMKLGDIAQRLDMPEEMLNILNAELRHKLTPNREYALKIPVGALQNFNRVYGEIPETQRPQFIYADHSYVRHRVRSGETVSTIARRYRVSPQEIYRYNKMKRNKMLPAGKVLRIPVRQRHRSSVEQIPDVNKSHAAATKNPVVSERTYAVIPGDTLLGIAKRLQVDVYELKAVNGLKENVIQAGQILKLPASSADATNVEDKKKILGASVLTSQDVAELGTNKHIVTRGDNLSVIARKYNVEMVKLMRWNDLSESDILTPGRILVVSQ